MQARQKKGRKKGSLKKTNKHEIEENFKGES